MFTMIIASLSGQEVALKGTKSLFSIFTKSLPAEKRPTFIELMKKMRLTKQMPKDQKKGAIQQLDTEIHKYWSPVLNRPPPAL